MTVAISKPAENLRERLTEHRAFTGAPPQQDFWFSGDSSKTNFAAPKGWKPKFVYVDGSIKRPGASEDFEVQFDGFVYSVEMAVAPAAVDVCIIAERVLP